MFWLDIASMVFVCVTANHLGLIAAIEERVGYELHVINCIKCFSFWCVLIYSVIFLRQIIEPLAISFLASYTGIWLELLEGYIDTLYYKIHGKIYSADD